MVQIWPDKIGTGIGYNRNITYQSFVFVFIDHPVVSGYVETEYFSIFMASIN
jgi:hypothetical protein